jgi:protein ImuB
MFGVVYAAAGSDPARLVEVAQEFSPRIDICGPREIALDLSGLERLFGDARTIASELRRTAADRGLQVRVAIAGTRTAARLVVRHRAGLTIVEPGGDAEMLAPLPLDLLPDLVRRGTPSGVPDVHVPAVRGRGPSGPPRSVRGSGSSVRGSRSPVRGSGSSDPDTGDAAARAALDLCATFKRWGLRTLGDIAALPPADVAARTGRLGVEWQRLARGEDPAPLVPAVPEERFEQALDLEWPIEGLEPLSFVLGRLIEPLSAHLERRDRGAAVLHVRLHLVSRAVHERSLQLPTPMRDPRTLRTLALLDLESHPPPAAIDRVVVAVDPTPGRIVQYSLLTRPLPSPEQVSTLMARLTALMGEGRCGSPAPVDSWRPGAFAMAPFAPVEAPSQGGVSRVGGVGGVGQVGQVGQVGRTLAGPGDSQQSVVVALRRFRFPVPARVEQVDGRPVRLMTDRREHAGGRIEKAAGPWRTSGEWWNAGLGEQGRQGGENACPWDRDEWDVTVNDGATYRLFRERDANAWFIDGVLD